MLIALNTSKEYEIGQQSQLDYVQELISRVPGKYNIVLPESIEHYTDILKKFRPKKKNHLVLLSNHQVLLKKATEGTWRAHEYLLQSRGGSTWGDDPGRASLTYAGTLENMDEIAKSAEYDYGRAILFSSMTKKYLGRTKSDPRLIVFGFTPTLPKTSQYAELLLSGLPSETGDQMPDEWWEGVGFISTVSDDQAVKVTDWFRDWTNFVTIGDKAHEQFKRLGISHGAIGTTNQLFKKKTLETAKSVGRMIRESARVEEDNRTWTP